MPVRLGLGLLILLVAAPGAPARIRPQPLVDAAPARAHFADRVLDGAPSARAAASRDVRVYRTADGTPVRVAFSDAYEPSDAVAQSYVDFLGDLTRGDELGELTVVIAAPWEVAGMCGREATLACYSGREELMIVPGEEIAAEKGVSTSYVVAHEYGHHVAANRDNAPFDALHFGPKRWSSAAGVCNHTLAGRLVPGDQDEHYFANPGEAWAEVYAQLKYPGLQWRFIGLLEPGERAVQAALMDVVEPWTQGLVRTFRGRFSRRGPDVRQRAFTLTLDGPLTIALDGPRRAEYDLVVSARGRERGRAERPGADERIRYPAACRERASEAVTVTVVRRAGSGPFTLAVRYAG